MIHETHLLTLNKNFEKLSERLIDLKNFIDEQKA